MRGTWWRSRVIPAGSLMKRSSSFDVFTRGAWRPILHRPAAAEPGGWPGVVYYRLHGSPRMYYSSYSPEFLRSLAERLTMYARPENPVWCIFDNTALGAATSNALELLRDLA